MLYCCGHMTPMVLKRGLEKGKATRAVARHRQVSGSGRYVPGPPGPGAHSTHSQSQSAVDWALLDRLSRSIVFSQKPQQENSAGKFGWGKIQPVLKAGAGLID
jgi:hypothetical protein